MLAVHRHLRAPTRLAPSLVERADVLVLDWHTRSKSRFGASDGNGRQLAVVLPRGSVLRGGDLLVAQDGSLLRVEAAAETLLRVRADDALALLRAAYHLGNRHVQLELRDDALQLEPDPVLEQMLLRMGLHVETVQAAFEPEAGAYGDAVAHGHHHHGHAQEHEHGHAHCEEHGHAHAHDPSGPSHG